MEQKGNNPYTSNEYNNGGYTNSSYDNYEYNTTYTGQSDMKSYSSTASAKKVLALSFLYMVIALIVSGVAAIMTAASGLTIDLVMGNGFTILLFAEFGLVLVSNFTIRRNNVFLSGILFLTYAVVNGMTCSIIMFAYAGESVVLIFFATAVMFAVISVIAAVTKKDLTILGIIGYMGLVGIIIISIFTLLFGQQLSTFIMIIALALFIGITAYDVQKIKTLANSSTGLSVNSLALFGAFNLYLDFINIFLKLLALFGKRRN